MRSIYLKGKDNLNYEIEITDKLIDLISQRRSIMPENLTDSDIVKFFVEAAGQAFDRAAVEYLAADAKAS
jgi:hypothetical protein